MAVPPPIDALREQARILQARSHVPFSNQPEAAVALLRDSTWVPGVRVESAAFSLTIPATLNLITTLIAVNRLDALVALTLSAPLSAADRQFLGDLAVPPTAVISDDTALWTNDQDALPSPSTPLPPQLEGTIDTPEHGIQRARDVSGRAYIPASNFPVGAVLETTDGLLIPGVNVEHTDWMRTLCAERNALSTAYSFGMQDFAAMYLSCPEDAQGTPCGACRQLLVELAPDIRLWMDRDPNAPDVRSPRDLLPGSFEGKALLQR